MPCSGGSRRRDDAPRADAQYDKVIVNAILLHREAFTMITTDAAAPYPYPDVAAAVARALSSANDRPNLGLDATRSPQKYAAMSRDFRSSAWQHLEGGDLPQASNKAWGMVAETVKAVSAQHGGIIHTHRSIMEVVTQLRRLLADAGDAETARQISRAFLAAGKLHINFYEDDLPDDLVLEGLIECEELSGRLYALFWREPAAG